jgi:N-acetylglucosaminyl-diphospho-decaprenol L-rhamnosyltransferase
VNTRWTLITVTWNSADTLRRFWSDPPPENVQWIVVDNASSDTSVATAMELGAASVIALDANIGFGAANNRALASATGDYIAFVNPDVSVEYGDLDNLARSIDARGGLVAPQLVNADGSLQANGRGMPTLSNKIRNRTRATPGLEDAYNIYASDGEARHVVWLMGAVVAGSATTIQALKGWNEKFFLYYEDSEIGVRAWSEGYTVVLDGAFRWVHGWARETKTFRLRPWMREIASMTRFYTLYPEFLWRIGKISSRHAAAYKQMGRVLAEAS